jgi:signal transduction histidine kinase
MLREQRVRRTALLLTAVNLAAVALLWAVGPSVIHPLPTAIRLLGFSAAFALVGALPMRLDFSEHRATFTLTDAVLVTGLFYLSAPWLGVAAALGELVRCLATRTPPLKTLFNSASYAATATVASAAFAVLGGGPSAGPGSWLPALAAVTCWGILNGVSVSTMIAQAEGRTFQQTLSHSIPTVLGTTILAAPLGLLVAELLHLGPLYPVLVLPIGLGVWLNNRYAAAQRDEHLRVERLYEATVRTAQLASGLDVVAVVAEESRLLLTGSVAFCCIREGDGPWIAQTARAGIVGGTRSDDINTILKCAGQVDGRARVVGVPEQFRRMAPDAEALVVARSPEGATVELIVAVLRRSIDERHSAAGLGGTLAAFAAHGAVIAANAMLLSKVQQSLESQLEANQRKDEFVATISHELRTPLTVMLGAAQTLVRLEGRIEREDRDRLLHTAVDQGKRLQLLIDDLLLVAAAEQGNLACELTPIATVQFAERLLADLPDHLRPHVRVDNAASDAAFTSDQHRLRQIVTNLTQNASKYAPDSPIEITIKADVRSVSVAVVDHGPGIPLADRDRVFDRFVQLDQTSTRSQGGTGLGLFICRKLAARLGATLDLQATPGGGCTFNVTLPRANLRRFSDADAADLAPIDSGTATADNQPSPLESSPTTAGLLRRPPMPQAPIPSIELETERSLS